MRAETWAWAAGDHEEVSPEQEEGTPSCTGSVGDHVTVQSVQDEQSQWLPELGQHDRRTVYDTITGDPLPPDLVRGARREEIDFMREWQVGELRDVAEAVSATGAQPLWGKWVDRNKGDAAKPNLRSRYVACEVATYRDDNMFAATPPVGGS